MQWKGESKKRFYTFFLEHREDHKKNMFVRCPSQRDAEDWVRCFAQIYEVEETIEENKGEFVIESRKTLELTKTMAKIDFVHEEIPKWADEANKLLRSSEEWELTDGYIQKKDMWRKKTFVINANSEICLDALLDKRGEWDFELKNYRKISSPENMRIYHALHKTSNITMLIQVYIDMPFQILISIEAIPHVYYPSNINFSEIFSIILHPFQQNSCMLTCITNTTIFDKSLPFICNYSEITSFKASNTEIHNIQSREDSENNEETDYTKPIGFEEFFVYGEGGDYERDPMNGGLILMDKDLISKQRGILSSMIKRIGKNLLTGKSIMNLSIPVYVFAKITLLQQLGNIYGYCPIFLDKAVQCSGLERFKYVVTLAISLLHLPTSQRKAFNPILGETFQGKIGKAQIFCEQVCHHPPISSFQILGEGYSIHGYYEFMASTSANSVKARQKGLTVIHIDKNIYYLTFPLVNISGTMIGKRYFNWQGILTVTSPSENLYCEVTLNPDKKGAISGIFGRSQTPSDFFTGTIQRVKPTHPILTEQGMKAMQESGKKSLSRLVDEVEAELCKIEGFWTLFLDIDKKRYWSFDEYRPYPLASISNPLPSDSTFRGDLKCMIEGNLEEAQVQKDILENIQRRDRKLKSDLGKH